MKIHHLNCGTMCPLAAQLVCGPAGRLVCHCLLLETPGGLVLVDTGYGTEDVLHPEKRIIPLRSVIGAKLDKRETAAAQIEGLGFKKEDVRHILLTHLDMDHAGGVSDFPHATVHLLHREHEIASSSRQSFIGKHRYSSVQWAHHRHWEFYDDRGGDTWMSFQAVKNLRGLPPEILLVPLLGHTLGHCGIAIQKDQGWLFHAGDAYFFHGEMQTPFHCPSILEGFQRVMAMDNEARLTNRNRLRQLVHTERPAGEIEVFCAHDFVEFDRMNPLQPAET